MHKDSLVYWPRKKKNSIGINKRSMREDADKGRQ
jgi:hypothetical protein